MQVTITDFIDNKHQSHYWYGGDCVKIKHRGYTAYISACGDIDATYFDSNDKHIIADFKDKNNGGRFREELYYYIADDKSLYEAIENGNLEIYNNNWWECYIIDPNGVLHDLMWCLDASYLKEAIKEVKAELDEMIDYIEEEKQQ